MSYSRVNATGETYETASKTIGSLIDREFLKANTENKKPKIFYNEIKPVPAEYEKSSRHVSVYMTGTMGQLTATLDDSQSHVQESLMIDVFSYSQLTNILIQKEIIRILRKNNPKGGVTILKSDNSSESGIIHMPRPLPTFTIPPRVQGQKYIKAQMLLTVTFLEGWTPA